MKAKHRSKEQQAEESNVAFVISIDAKYKSAASDSTL